MKHLFFTIAALLVVSCSTNKTSQTATVGEWYTGNLKGKSFKLGSQENIELVKKVAAAYNAMDAEKLITYFSEDAKIYVHSGEELQVSLAHLKFQNWIGLFYYSKLLFIKNDTSRIL